MRLVSSGLLTRAAGVFVLGFVVVDLGDASCCPLAIPGGGPVVSTPRPEVPDACASFCVPDCFCCSSTVPAAQAASIHLPRPVSERPALSLERPTSGFTPVPEHIPLAAI
jgi:hypothetical protein